MSSAEIKRILWWVCLVAAPAVLIALELFHPAHFTARPGMFEFLSKPQAYDSHFVAFGWQLETAHASPHGPIAFALLIVAAIRRWWLERATPESVLR
jgi:hypothetical protein